MRFLSSDEWELNFTLTMLKNQSDALAGNWSFFYMQKKIKKIHFISIRFDGIFGWFNGIRFI